jgi:hypothetical protein
MIRANEFFYTSIYHSKFSGCVCMSKTHFFSFRFLLLLSPPITLRMVATEKGVKLLRIGSTTTHVFLLYTIIISNPITSEFRIDFYLCILYLFRILLDLNQINKWHQSLLKIQTNKILDVFLSYLPHVFILLMILYFLFIT